MIGVIISFPLSIGEDRWLSFQGGGDGIRTVGHCERINRHVHAMLAQRMQQPDGDGRSEALFFSRSTCEKTCFGAPSATMAPLESTMTRSAPMHSSI